MSAKTQHSQEPSLCDRLLHAEITLMGFDCALDAEAVRAGTTTLQRALTLMEDGEHGEALGLLRAAITKAEGGQ